MSKYEDLKKLESLKLEGTITDEEFRQEKDKILNALNSQSQKDNHLGMRENDYLMLMHVSQFVGFLLSGLGFIIPIVLWQIARKSEVVDKHGKNIVNFILSMFIYFIVFCILCLLLVRANQQIVYALVLFIAGFAVIVALVIITFIIIATIKANRGEFWRYPLSIPFFRYKK